MAADSNPRPRAGVRRRESGQQDKAQTLMDARQKHPDDGNPEGQGPDPLEELDVSGNQDDVEEIDDAAILNELLRDLSPELLQEEPSEREPAREAQEPSSEVAALSSEEAATVGAPEKPERQPAPAEPSSIREEAQPQERVEETSYEEALKALVESEEQGRQTAQAQEPVKPKEERRLAEGAPSDGGLFTEAAIDAAFAALTGTGEPTKEAQEEAAIEARPSAAFPAEAQEPLVPVGGKPEAAKEKRPRSEAEAPPATGAAEAPAAVSSAVPGQPTAQGELSLDVVAGIARMVAERYLGRLSQELERGVRPAPPAAVKERPVPRAAKPAPAEVVRPREEELVPKEAERPEQIGVDLFPVADLLTPEEERKAEGVTAREAEPSLDELITSAVLTTEEARAEPTAQEVKAEPEAAPEEAVVAEPVGALEEDPLIREMRQRQRRRRIISAAVAVVVILAAGVGYLTMTRGPSSEQGVTLAQPAAQAVQPTQEPATTTAAPPAQAVQEPLPAETELPVKPPQPPTPAPPTSAPEAAPTPTVAEGVPPKLPVSPEGQYTLHVESLANTAGVQSTREKWRARGYDVFIWEFVRPSDGTRWYRVGVGRFASRRDGETAKQLLRAAYPDEIDWSPVTRIPEGAR